ncbi:MAG: hypothetical protein HY686_05935 [Chloroflexi bacterium]|nr:hypothetical protein [Chloroflexota bacterium]
MLESTMKCKFCGNESELIEAHIIPAGFFRRLKQGQEPLEIVTNRGGEYTKKSRKGVYDQTIVCSKCELIWQGWDNYAQQLLAEEPLNGRARYHGNRKICYVVDNFEYRRLKLFFISMLWRASVSSQKFFSRLCLGRFEDIAKQHIVNSAPGNSEDFSVVLSKFDHPLAKGILDPYMYENSGVKYIRFYFASYMADIKVDRKKTPEPLSKLVMTENKPLYILCRNFQESKELDLMQQLIRMRL